MVVIPPKPDLLVDIKYPRNLSKQVQDIEERVSLLEKFYGTIANHSALDNLTNDDHKQYATDISSTDRRATAADHVQTASGNRLSIGTGVPTKPGGVNPKVDDVFIRLDTPTVANQRIYFCTTGGQIPVWQGVL